MSEWTLTDRAAIILKSYGVDDYEAARAVVALVMEADAQVAESRWKAWSDGDGFHDADGLPAVSCDVTACENIAAALRARIPKELP